MTKFVKAILTLYPLTACAVHRLAGGETNPLVTAIQGITLKTNSYEGYSLSVRFYNGSNSVPIAGMVQVRTIPLSAVLRRSCGTPSSYR